MADHLPLPPAQELQSRRRTPGPSGRSSIDRSSRAFKLSSDLQSAVEEVLQSDDYGLDPTLVLKLHAVTRLASGPLNGLNLIQLGEGQGWTYAVLSDQDSRTLLNRLIDEYSSTEQGSRQGWNYPLTWAALLDNVEGISLYGEEDRRDSGLGELSFSAPEIIDILIWPSPNVDIATERLTEVLNLIERLASNGSSAEALFYDNRPQATVIRARVDEAALNRVLQESWVERVRPPLRATFTRRNVSGATLGVDLPTPSGALIGLLDGVVSTANPLLARSVAESRGFPEGHIFSGPDLHGTAVASIAVWGSLDFVVNGGQPPPNTTLISARVLDVNPATNELYIPRQEHSTLEAAIRWLVTDKSCRIVCLTINRSHAVDTLLRSEVCATLDSLARELDFVLVVSSGNRMKEPATSWLSGYPQYLHDDEARVADPADAALAITVGSVAHRDIPGNPSNYLQAIAKAGEPSPFARCGPVRGRSTDGMAKPELAHAGGNFVYDHTTGAVAAGDPGVEVVVATPPIGGQILSTEVGSSFAAPAVAYELSRIAARYPSASPNMLRALIALAARRTESGSLPVDVTRNSAYGVPDADRVLESGGPVAILTAEDEIGTNTVAVHELPIPYEFALGGSSREFRVALAFDPPTLRSRREYLAGGMTVELVRGLNYDQVVQHYERQPSTAEAEADPLLVKLDLPSGRLRPNLVPRARRIASNTLLRRDYVDRSWDPDDEQYFLVVTHTLSPWTPRQRRAYSRQRYSIAVQLVERDRLDLDLHGLVRAQLRARARTRIRLA
jgi:Subtilase family